MNDRTNLKTLPTVTLWGNNFKISLVLIAAFTVFAGVAPVYAGCNDSLGSSDICASRLTFTIGSTTYRIPYKRNHNVDVSSSAYTRAIIVIHGCQRNALDYYQDIEDIVTGEDKLLTTLIIAPQFLRKDSDANDIANAGLGGENNLVAWNNGWKIGYNSVYSTASVSTYEVVDIIIDRLESNFSSLKQIVVVGHSAGGQFVNRYAAGTDMPEQVLDPAGIDIRYIVANPSSYVYLNNNRWKADTTSPYEFEIPSNNCTSEDYNIHYNRYRYGLGSLSLCPYLNSVGSATIIDQYQNRNMVYLLGEDDTERSSSLDKTCPADLQGDHRFERGTVYYEHLKHYYPGIHYMHRKRVVPDVDHDHEDMFKSADGKKYIMYGLSKPFNVVAANGTSVGGVNVTWSSVSGATNYTVLRSTAKNGPWTIVGSTGLTNDFDATATVGVLYYYSVYAQGSTDYSARSRSDTGWVGLAAPTTISATDGTYADRVDITWSAVAGVTHYAVYRATSEFGQKTMITSSYSVTGTSYSDTTATPGVTYYYFVQGAISSSGTCAGDFHRNDTGWRKLSPPTGVLASDGDYTSKVEIEWGSVSGASHYQVWRSTSVVGSKTITSGWQTGRTFNHTTSATPGVRYYYWVKAAINSSGDRESTYSSYNIGWRKLSPPSTVSASDGMFTDKVQITWNTASGASHYRVYRATSAGVTPTAKSGWQSGTSYNDTSATAGVTYYYWVTSATSGSGADESGYGSYNTGWRAFAPPANVSASDGTYTDKVYITWSSVGGATHYRVYRATSAGGTPTAKSGWQTGTSYNDTSAQASTTYYYWVKAANSSGGAHESDYGSYDTGWRKSILLPPVNVAATDGTYTAKVQITWNPASGASCYRVYRATSAGGTKSAICPWQPSASYNDTTATPGVTYYYWVKSAADYSGDEQSDYSSYNSGWRAMSPPTSVSASDGIYTNRIEISWNTTSGASHYRLYYGTAQYGDKTPLSSWQTGTGFSHTSPEPGETYWYWVKSATNASGNRASDYSDPAEDGWCPLASPAWASASDGTYADKVRVTWAAVAGASNYQVYRAPTATGTKTAVSDWLWSGTTYDDTTATPGVTYYYWVKAARNMFGWRAGDYSPSDTGWCVLSIGFVSGGSDGLETTSLAEIDVVLSYPATGQKTVDYAVTGGTALNGTDYNLAPGTLTFEPGQTTRTIDIDVIYDGLTESDETIQITLSNPGGGKVMLGAITSHTYTILDNTLYQVCPDGSGDFTTIQAAINSVSDRDVIELCDATYSGSGNYNIDYKGKAITVRSQSGNPNACIINCGGQNGFKFVNDETNDSILEGVTVQNGSCGIVCGVVGLLPPFGQSHFGSPTIDNCIITNNSSGGGMSCIEGSEPLIRNCIFSGNTRLGGLLGGAGDGGGLNCEESSPTLDNCTFINNSAACSFGACVARGGGMSCFAGAPTLTNCVFYNNNAKSAGGGFACLSSRPTITNCIFSDNVAGTGGLGFGGGVASGESAPTFNHCTFSGNSGGALWCHTGTGPYKPAITNCTFYGNSASYGGCIYLQNFLSGIPINNTIIAFSTQGEAVDCYSATAVLTCCDVYGNAGGDWVSGIAGQGTLRNNISLDPLFCNPANDNFRLQSTSPCLPYTAPNPPCGLIGAWPLGYPADLDMNGSVDFFDFADFAQYWRQNGCGVCGGADLAGDDGQVGLDDLREFVKDWLAGIE